MQYIKSPTANTLHKAEGTRIPNCKVKGHNVKWEVIEIDSVAKPLQLCRSCFRDLVPRRVKRKRSANGRSKFPRIKKVTRRYCLKCQTLFCSEGPFNKICIKCNRESNDIYVPHKIYSLGAAYASYRSKPVTTGSNKDHGTSWSVSNRHEKTVP